MREILDRRSARTPTATACSAHPRRVAEMYAEIFARAARGSRRTTSTSRSRPTTTRWSWCATSRSTRCASTTSSRSTGTAHVAYIPGDDGRITGLSKLARLVDGFAKRPQVQERLTTQIADALVEVARTRAACS